MTFGSSISIHSLYCLYLLSKWVIQLTSFFSVYGASLDHIGGNKPLKKQFPRTSRSTLIPISPFRALLRSVIELCILTMSLLYLSSSWSSTTYVGDGISKDFLMLYSSKGCGKVFVWMSSASCVMTSSLLTPPAPPPPLSVYIIMMLFHKSLAALV